MSVEPDDPPPPTSWRPTGLSEARSLLELALGDLAPDEPVVARDRYELRALLGRGGMGEVRLAHDQTLRRDVALKTLRIPDPDPRTIARFLQEAQITGQLEHPGIVPVHDVGVDEAGTPFFTMRRIDGTSLAQRMEAGELGSIVDRLDVFKKICDAVAFAHSRGVVHSDLKPSNVMVGAFGQVMVLDWGIAKIVGETEERDEPRQITSDSGDDLTHADAILGTPSYMSPEQARGERDELGPASDIYSLGAVLYALLTGSAPFRQPEPHLRLHAVAIGQLQSPRQRDPSVPAELDAVVRTAMALEPTDRYPTALALRDDVHAYLEGRPLAVVRYSVSARASKWVWRHRRIVGPVAVTVAVAATLLVSAGVAGATLFVLRVSEARDRAVAAEGTAQERYADGLVTLAKLQADSGHAPDAVRALSEAPALYADLDLDPIRADVVASYVRALRPPPVVTWIHPEGLQTRPILRRDGKQLLSRDTDGTLRLHELPSGELLAEYVVTTDLVKVSFEFQGEVPIVGVGSPEGVQAIDIRTGEILLSLPAPDDPDYRIRVSPDSTAVFGPTSGVSVWDRHGQSIGSIPELGALRGMSDDGTRVVGHPVVGSIARQATDLRVIDVPTGTQRAVVEASNVALSPSGDWVVLTGNDAVLAIDANTGDTRWRTPMTQVSTAMFAAQEHTTVVTTLDGWARWLRLEDGTIVQERRIDGIVSSLAREGELLAVDTGEGWSVWMSASQSPWVQIDDDGITSSAVSADQELLLTSGWSGRVRLWNWRTGTLLLDLAHTAQGVRDVAFLDGGRQAVSGARDGTIARWDLQSGARLATWTPDTELGLVMAVVPLPGDTEVLAVYETGDVRVWSVTTGKVTRTLDLVGIASVWDASLSPNGVELLVSGRGDQDPAAVVMSLPTGDVRPVTHEHTAAYQAAWRPDGGQVAVGTHVAGVLVYAPDGTHEWTLDSLKETLAVGYEPSGRLLASGNYAGEVQLWNAETGELLLHTQLHQEAVSRIDWAGQTLLSFDGNGRLHRFDLAPQDDDPAGPGALRLALARDALAREDWASAARLLERARSEGATVDEVEFARAYAGIRELDNAVAAMALAVEQGALTPGTAAVWRAALMRQQENR